MVCINVYSGLCEGAANGDDELTFRFTKEFECVEKFVLTRNDDLVVFNKQL